jgi:hypothetical protein
MAKPNYNFEKKLREQAKKKKKEEKRLKKLEANASDSPKNSSSVENDAAGSETDN